MEWAESLRAGELFSLPAIPPPRDLRDVHDIVAADDPLPAEHIEVLLDLRLDPRLLLDREVAAQAVGGLAPPPPGLEVGERGRKEVLRREGREGRAYGGAGLVREKRVAVVQEGILRARRNLPTPAEERVAVV